MANSESSTSEGQLLVAGNEHERELSQAGEQGDCLRLSERLGFVRSITSEGSPATIPDSLHNPLCSRCKHGVRYEIPFGYYCETKRNFGVEYNCKEFEGTE